MFSTPFLSDTCIIHRFDGTGKLRYPQLYDATNIKCKTRKERQTAFLNVLLSYFLICSIIVSLEARKLK